MTTMNIKDPEVHRMARALARHEGTSLTGAVRMALERALKDQHTHRGDISGRLLELGAASRAITEPMLTDGDLYDQDGLPR